MSRTKINIVLPCYNPNETWPDELLKFNDAVKDKFEVDYIVVNDGSISGNPSNQVVNLKNKNISISCFSYEKNMGKGYALRFGIEKATSNLIVYTDIDFPFENESIIKVIEKLAEGADVAVGYRELNYYEKVPFVRKMISKFFRFFLKRILRIKITDTQCGLKGFNLKGRESFLKTTINRYLFDFEFVYRISKKKELKVVTVPVVLKNGVVFRKMPLGVLMTEAFNVFKVILRRG